MKQLAVTAAGREVDGTNIIDERFLAESIRNIRGWDVGVLDNSNLSQNSSFENYLKDPNPDFVWRLTPRIAEDIIVGRGMASAYGYDIKSEENVSFSVVRPSTGTKYVFIYLEWDFSDLSVRYGKIDLWDNGSNSEWTPNTADLINNPLGNYQLPLYRIAIDTSGNITGVLNWTGLGRMASKGNAEITQNINGANATALVYRGVMWSKLSDLALESKKARVVIDNKSGSNNEITLASGDKLTNKDGGFYKYLLIDNDTNRKFETVYESKGQVSTAEFIPIALNAFGFTIEEMQANGGVEFANRFTLVCTLEHIVDAKLRELGIKHKLILPGTPRHNGKVERFHRKCQERFYNTHRFRDLDDINEQISQWLVLYNNTPNRSLVGLDGKFGKTSPNDAHMILLQALRRQEQSKDNAVQMFGELVTLETSKWTQVA